MSFVDYRPEFPEWAPKEVQKLWIKDFDEWVNHWIGKFDDALIKEWYFDDEDCRDVSLLERLLTEPQMEKVWDKIKENGIDPVTFALTAQVAFLDIDPFSQMTVSNFSRWEDKVKEHAEALADLLEGKPHDELLWNEFAEASSKDAYKRSLLAWNCGLRPNCESDGESEPFKPSYRPPRLSAALRQLAGRIRTYKTPLLKKGVPDFFPNKPSAPHERENRFILRMTDFFCREAGSPLRDHVRVVSTVAFKKPISKRRVEKVARNPLGATASIGDTPSQECRASISDALRYWRLRPPRQ